MAANVGRNVTLTWNGVEMLGAREKGIALNGAPIDVTADDDAGWRALLAVAAQDEVNLSISGVSKDAALKEDWFGGARTQAVLVTYPDGSSISGQFYLASYSEGTPYNEAITFAIELMSTGVVTYTPA